MKYTITDEFETTAERYWQVFFDDAYNEALFRRLKIGRQVLEMRREGEGEGLVIHRRQVLTPEREVPAIFRKLVKGAITYTESNVFRARDDRMEVVTVPGFGADKITTRGVYRLEPVGEGRVRRIWEGECACSVPLIGGKIESTIVDEVKATYRETTAFTRAWLADHRA